ncbi:hypothetical protein KA005_76365, partial [bacterium]|nr:hypothetical protein [bacterium]
YETNEYKLLQIVIFAQREFQQTLKEHANFADRMNVCLFLGPLNFRESRLMIKFRLDKASMGNSSSVKFSYPALWAIYKATGGYPRKIINLCHQIILTLIIQNRFRVSWALVRSCVKRVPGDQSRKWHWAVATVLTCLLAIALILGATFRGRLTALIPWKTNSSEVVLKSTLSVNSIIQDNKKNFTEGTPALLQIAAAQSAPAPLELNENMDDVLTEVIERLPSEKTPALLKQTQELPQMLGQIKAMHGETVLEMIHKVYGAPALNRLGKILPSMVLLNPRIKDLDGIYVGDAINFPALPIHKSLPSSGCWIQLIEEDMLEKAYRFMRVYRDSEFPVRMLPYWNSRDGLRFAIIIKAFFTDKESAEISLKKLPAMISSGAKIVTKLDDDTVFFSNIPVE